MINKNPDNDIDLIKCEAYIKKKPSSSIGHLRLGNLYMKYGFYNKAKNSFMKSYNHDSRYTQGIIGAAISEIHMGHYIRGVKLINRISTEIMTDSSLSYKLLRNMSFIYDSVKTKRHASVNAKLKRFSSPFIQKLFNLNTENPLNLFLLCVNRLTNYSQGRPEAQDIVLFEKLAYKKGISPEIRYVLINKISSLKPDILKDKEFGKLFFDISDNMGLDFTNFIFETILDSFNFHHIKRIYRSINNFGKPIYSSNLWKFVYLSSRYSCMDISTMNSCLKLLRRGWVDKTVLDAVKRIDQKQLKRYEIFV